MGGGWNEACKRIRGSEVHVLAGGHDPRWRELGVISVFLGGGRFKARIDVVSISMPNDTVRVGVSRLRGTGARFVPSPGMVFSRSCGD